MRHRPLLARLVGEVGEAAPPLQVQGPVGEGAPLHLGLRLRLHLRLHLRLLLHLRLHLRLPAVALWGRLATCQCKRRARQQRSEQRSEA